MSLPSPNLDDRTFDQLLAEAQQRIARSCPTWTDRSPSDPGIVLLELFAYLTEVMIYRLNRLPHKVYVELLRLLDVRLAPPGASCTTLQFKVSQAGDQRVEIPAGTRVTTARAGGETEAPIFVTTDPAFISPGAQEVDVLAYHCEIVIGELAGIGTGLPGQVVTVRRPPIVAPTGDSRDLMVGVEAPSEELSSGVPAMEYQGKSFRIWREVENFTAVGRDRFVYLADRSQGRILFAPAVRMQAADGELDLTPEALAEVPRGGREIRIWYWRGEGLEGNVPAHTLTVMKDPIPGVEVTNPTAATGGRPVETLDNALIRGPLELHSLERAVTAQDFEFFAKRCSGSVERANAFTKVTMWKHAVPGTVEVLLVPSYLTLEQRGGGRVTAEKLREQESEEARQRVKVFLDERRPLGTVCWVNWVRYKTVRVQARVVVYRGENPDMVKARVLERLHQTINPLPTPVQQIGWRFGQPLRVSHVYDIMLSEPGVSYVDNVSFLVDDVPDQEVRSLVADRFQPFTWYAACSHTLYRSMNDAESWEPAGQFPGQEVLLVNTHQGKPGLLAVATRDHKQEGNTQVHVSWDSGESWRFTSEFAFAVNDMAWLLRDGVPTLILATDKGLYELSMQPGATPVQILVEPTDPDRGFYAVAVAHGVRGEVSVAVAARSLAGVYLSTQGGSPGTFAPMGLTREDVRVLAVQYDGPRSFLWAGLAVAGNEAGKGCFCLELTGSQVSSEDWRLFGIRWTGGSCRALAFLGTQVLAATYQAGVIRLEDSTRPESAWNAPGVDSGLPLRDVERIYHPVSALAANPQGRLFLAGGSTGIYRGRLGEQRFEACSKSEFTEKVTLPQTWLFCSGQHEIVVEQE